MIRFTADGYTPARHIPVIIRTMIPRIPLSIKSNDRLINPAVKMEIAKIDLSLNLLFSDTIALTKVPIIKPIGIDICSMDINILSKFHFVSNSTRMIEVLNHRLIEKISADEITNSSRQEFICIYP